MRLKVVSLIVFAVLWGVPAQAAPIVSLQPSLTTVSVGQTFSLDIFISGVVDLYAYQFDIGFNPSVVAASEPTEGLFLPFGGATFFFPGAPDNIAGTVSFNAGSLQTAVVGVTGSGVLARIEFTAVGAGTLSPINLFGVVLLDSGLAGIAGTTTVGASVTVQGTAVVPEPATWVFLGSGLLAIRRRRALSSNHSRRK